MAAFGLFFLTVLLAAGVYATQRRTSVILNAPYALVEWQAFSALGLDRDELVASKHAQSHARGEISTVLTMEIHTHRLVEYEPDEHIHFRGDHRYNIMAVGSERLEVDIREVSPVKTKVTLDYAENTWLFGLIPTSWRLGWSQERRLVKAMFGR